MKTEANTAHFRANRARTLPEAMALGSARLGLSIGLILVGGSACHQTAPDPASTVEGRVLDPATEVARVGEAIITRAALEREMARTGGSISPREALHRLVQFEAMLARARAEGLHQDPALRERIDRMIVAHYEESRSQRHLATVPEVLEADIERHYREQPGRFTQPEKRRAGVLFLRGAAMAGPEQKLLAERRADELQRQAEQADAAGFVSLVRSHSEDQSTRYQGGDAGWLESASARWPAAVMRAIFELKAPGMTSPVLHTDQGFHIVRLLARQPSRLESLETARESIAHVLNRERVEWARQAFLSGLTQGLHLEINQPLLDAMPVAPPPNALQAGPIGLP